MANIYIDSQGRIRHLWDDELAALRSVAGVPKIARASHVEPNEDGQWTVDLSPVGGGVLGPFALHGQALEAERQFLDRLLGAAT